METGRENRSKILIAGRRRKCLRQLPLVAEHWNNLTLERGGKGNRTVALDEKIGTEAQGVCIEIDSGFEGEAHAGHHLTVVVSQVIIETHTEAQAPAVEVKAERPGKP